MQEQENAKGKKSVNRLFLDSIVRGDNWIWGIYVFLFVFSLVEMFSASSQLAYKSMYASDPAFSHAKNLFYGIVAVLVGQSMSIRSLRACSKLVYFMGVVLAFAVIFVGVQQKGAARSIGILQPVEICKIGIIMALCTAITAKDEAYEAYSAFQTKTQGKRYWFYILLIVLVAGPIMTQNLSSSIIICLASFGVLFIAKVKGKYLVETIVIVGILGALFMLGLYQIHRTHQDVQDTEQTVEESSSNSNKEEGFALDKWINRASTWSNRIYEHSDKPLWEENINGKKSQEIYSHMALANGLPMGRFIGGSKLRDFLPEAYSDYIFAIIFEEWGPLGATIVLALYLLLFLRCYHLSKQTEDPYIRLLIVGIPLIIVIQALIHIGVCTGAMFVTGQPLPLISRGGSSIVGTSFSIGIILGLTRLIRQENERRNQPKEIEQTTQENEIPN